MIDSRISTGKGHKAELFMDWRVLLSVSGESFDLSTVSHLLDIGKE